MTQETFPLQTRRFALGIDAGGTSVRAMLSDALTGEVLAEEHFSAAADGGPGPLDAIFSQARFAALANGVVGVVAGITKFTREGVADAWKAALSDRFPDARRSVVPDYVIAFHAAIPGGRGIIVIAGTGSVVYGEDGSGEAVRVGGRGWEYGDEGSGAHMTTDAIRRTLRALDKMTSPTSLTDALIQYMGTREPALFAEAARQRAVSEGRGFLFPILLSLAQGGDDEARNLIAGAAGWLAAWTRAAYRQLSFGEDERLQIGCVGGIWSAGAMLLEPFHTIVQRWIPNFDCEVSASEPALGAVRLACRQIDKSLPSP